ncbi:MAG TPA: delta-60 repeat domain-containing protein, partial [Solirubrobacterales bacterium]
AAFGEGGFTTPLKLPFGGFDNLAPQAEALAVQRDGKLVVAGFSQEGVRESVAFAPLLARYRADGSLDPSFVGDGIVGKAPQAHGGTEYHDVAVTGKGTILVAGGRDEEGVGVAAPAGVLAAYRPDGSPDTAFGERGQVLFKGRHAAYYSTLRAVQVLPSGKILLAGYLDSELFLARLTAAGRLDHGFGDGDGEVTLNLHDPFCCEEAALALAPGGRIVVAGMGGSLSKYRVFLARYLASGRLDRGFANKGVEAPVLRRRLGTLLGLAVQPDGKIVTVGRTEITKANPDRAFALFRNLPSGRPDRGFGREGLYTLRHGTESIAAAALTLPSGVLVGGSFLDRESQSANSGTTLLLGRVGATSG